MVLYVVSSTGDGDPPDNAARFYSALRRLAKKEGADGAVGGKRAGAGCQYAVLGLGDQNYTRFMAVPR